MDKTAIRNYAVAARRKLIEAVRQKAFALYIFEDGALPPEEAYHRLRADGIFLTPSQSEARQRLVSELATLGDTLDNETAYSHVMEEVAYTWFNRLIALRFMEVNDYLPSGIRILSSLDKGRVEPDAMREAERLDYVDQKKIAELRADASAGAAAKLYRYILIAQCNALSEILPGMFEKLGDYTELLLPDSLYAKGGIVHDLVNAIAEDDFRDQVQVIGWLYQYYIAEKKDEVFANLKRNIKINKETIPAATQLFTPEWIVKYMVENSLGRLWLERDRAESGLSSEYMNASYYGWKYYVEEAEQELEVAEQLRALRAQSPIKRPEDIRLIDPCMGSGHILVYAFDVLYQIYQSWGYAERDIPNLILTHNLYGLDIDDRAGQLAYFALMMKARSYNRRFFRQESIPQPMVYAFVETGKAQKLHLKLMGQGMMPQERQWRIDEIEYLMDLFVNAREYGSISKIERKLDYTALRRFVKDSALGQMDWQAQGIEHTERVLLSILDLAEALALKYDVVVTNPPYMGSSGMGSKLSDYVKAKYPDSKADLFAVFIERCGELTKGNCYQAMITQHSWMFLSSYENLRAKLMQNDIVSMAHLGARAFEEIGGEVVQTTSFVIRKCKLPCYRGGYHRLISATSQMGKEKMYLAGEKFYKAQQEDFSTIPGTPIAYWISEKTRKAFASTILNDVYPPKAGLSTGDNDRFLRFFWEVSMCRIFFNGNCRDELRHMSAQQKWVPMTKGGNFRRWYGNNEYILNFAFDGIDLKYWLEHNPNDPKTNSFSRYIRNYDKYLLSGISFNDVSAGKTSFRLQPNGFIPNARGPFIYSADYALLGYLNTNVCLYFLNIIAPTLTFNVGDVARIPYLNADNENIAMLVKENVSYSKIDWDSFETSWDFKRHPLLQYGASLYSGLGDGVNRPTSDIGVSNALWIYEKNAPVHATVETSFNMWQHATEERFNQLKSNEEELNRIFIDIYGLQDELTPEVEDKDVTIRKADLGRDIRSFLSYAVGCMFGRYSLDEPGLIYAGGQFSMSRYKTYLPEEDNIIPIGSADYFDDDIVVRFTDFVRKVYGEDTLGENLNFIADALYPSGSGSARERIRRYFLNDFYKDHVKIYQKRPIYWLLDSGKSDGFKALVYLHRYDKFTVARVRTDYLHPLQRKYEAEVNRLDMLSASTENIREKAAYRKEIDTLRLKMEECRVYDQVVSHIAHQQIELDLDDGVKVNYAKFQDVAVPKDNGKTEKMDLLAKI